jgi:hypothetical protein
LWYPPSDCPAGTPVQVDAWGGGAGASARTAGNYGAAGAGGAYVRTPVYFVTPDNVANGVTYVLGGGGAGSAGANPVPGGTTIWSNSYLNLHYNSANAGAVMPSTLPTGWYTYTGDTGLTATLIGFGTTQGLPYIDIKVAGTVTGAAGFQIYTCGGNSLPLCPVTPSNNYIISTYTAIVGGSVANITNIQVQSLSCLNNAYVGTNNMGGNNYVSTTASLTRNTATVITSPASGVNGYSLYFVVNYLTGAVINVTLRMAGIQFELGSVPTAYKVTPGSTIAPGGGAPSGTTGGAGTLTGAIYGLGNTTGAAFAGGNGANYNAAGSGGGGSGGPGGAGGNGTTAGAGGTGDAGAVAGGAVKAISPGNPGSATIGLGAGGGGGLTTVSGIGGAGVQPGGGGGAAAAGGTGGAGGGGAIQLTYASVAWPYDPQAGLAPFMAS